MSTRKKSKPAKQEPDMLSEYSFDYSKAKPNRFAGQATVSVQLDPDVAAVFQDASSVNNVLRALVATMPQIRRQS
ncbi:hypothetical protein F183_A23570 [Bryobacterales bacterium F-183]|nr:hypothetical protein F183_A23570 [Bryobacterales bacterium F-183]